MSDLRKAAHTALEAWDRSRQWPFPTRPDKEFDALRAALAQPEQQLTLTFDAFVKQIRNKAIYETIYADTEGRDILVITLLDAYRVLMRQTDPPQRKPLTDEERERMLEDYATHGDIVRAVEKAHGIE